MNVQKKQNKQYTEKGICTQKICCTDFYSGVLTEVGW